MKKIMSIAGVSTTLLGNVFPLIAAAQSQASLPPPPITTPGQAINIICTVAGWLFAILIVLAVIFVIIAAFRYLFTGASSEGVEKANKALIFAAVAIAIALLARAVPLIISGILGSSYQSTGC